TPFQRGEQLLRRLVGGGIIACAFASHERICRQRHPLLELVPGVPLALRDDAERADEVAPVLLKGDFFAARRAGDDVPRRVRAAGRGNVAGAETRAELPGEAAGRLEGKGSEP